MSTPQTLNGKVVLKVYTLDNSMKTLLVEPTSTVHDVCRAMGEKIGFPEPEDDSLCFSLCECADGATIGRALAPDLEVLGIMEGWRGKPDAKFIYQAKLYTDSAINSKDPKIVHMLFIQGVYNVVTGNYPTTEKEAIQLAALQFQARFGPHNPASHKPGFLTGTIAEYLPAAHLEKGGKTTAQWEELIFHKHAFSTTSQPREMYLAMLTKRDYYGAVLFAVKQKYDRAIPKKIYLGISRRGITLLKIPKTATEDGMETVAQFALADIYRWAYKPGINFYFEIKATRSPGSPGAEDGNQIFTYETPEGKHMSDMLTDYALALLREMGLNPDGTKRVKAKAASSGTGTAAAGAGAAPAQLPSKDAMSASTDAYRSVAGDVGSLASAAVRSGEYADAKGSGVGAGTGATGPPTFAPPPPPPASAMPPPPPGALPAGWIECADESTGDKYYFNTATGDSVWERDEIPA